MWVSDIRRALIVEPCACCMGLWAAIVNIVCERGATTKWVAADAVPSGVAPPGRIGSNLAA